MSSGVTGRKTRAEYLLTNEQRAVLGTDQWFDVESLAAILGVTEIAIRNAIDRGTLPTRFATNARGNRVASIKGWRAIIWRDSLAGVSDGDEDAPEAMP